MSARGNERPSGCRRHCSCLRIGYGSKLVAIQRPILVNGRVSQSGIEDYLKLLSVYETCRYKEIGFLNFLLSSERNIGNSKMIAEQLWNIPALPNAYPPPHRVVPPICGREPNTRKPWQLCLLTTPPPGGLKAARQ